MGHALMENRNGLIVGAVATRASGHAERLAALHLIEPHADRPRPSRSAATRASIRATSSPNFARSTSPRMSRRTTTGDARPSMAGPRAIPGYAVSLRIRKRIEEAFGWAKTVAGLRKARHRGLPKIDWQFTFAMAAYNLVRLPKLLGAAV